MTGTLIRVLGCNRIGRQDYPSAEHGPRHGAVNVTEDKRVVEHGICAQLEIVSQGGCEVQRGIINST